jgi:lysophospholipase L1-like esterase
MTRFTRTLLLLLLGCGGLAVSALLLEAGVLLLLGEQARFSRHVVGADFGVRINVPNARYTHHSADVDVEFRINSKGMRADRNYPYEKPDGVLRIVALGDSYTVGYEVEAEETFSSVLQRELRRSGHDVEVLNTGVSGYSNAEALLYLERELLRYEPDVVVLSFVGNDLVDNVRSGLFRLEDGELAEDATSYVPAGRLGDLLNRNPFLNWLSERSNAFVLIKERVTLLLKRRLVAANQRNVESQETPPFQRQLAAVILDRLHRTCQERGIALVIQSIPTIVRSGTTKQLVDLFPLDEFDVSRSGLVFFAARQVLEPRLHEVQLYHERSHGHWTPEAHRLSGEALATLIGDGILEAKAQPRASMDHR